MELDRTGGFVKHSFPPLPNFTTLLAERKEEEEEEKKKKNFHYVNCKILKKKNESYAMTKSMKKRKMGKFNKRERKLEWQHDENIRYQGESKHAA